MVREYECPGCGAPMVFDSKEQKMVCEHCGTAMSVQQMEQLQKEKQTSEDAEQDFEEVEQTDTEYQTGKGETFHRYTCPSCGAEVLTDEHTAATFCSFCGNPTMMEDRLSGEKTPACIIPFKIDRQQAQEKYRSWCKKGILTPKDFTSQSTIEKITGMYVPFWLYDYKADARIEADCTKVSRQRRGDIEYTHTDHYRVRRHVSNVYEKVPADASEKMPDDVMDKLEPYAYSELQDFNMGYLSGYMAEKYNFGSDGVKKRVEERVNQYILAEAQGTITGYSTTMVTDRRVHLNCRKATYAMLPVWLLNYRYKGKEYLFTLNGQTGKIVGQLPRSREKMLAWFAGITAASYLILTVLEGVLS